MTEPTATWLYAATSRPPGPLGGLAGVVGVAGEPVRAVGEAGLVAVVGDVELAEFGAEALRRNLEDLDWLDSRTRAHHAVVAAAAAGGPVLPLRFGTVCPGEERVRALLADHREALLAALRRVEGRTEWGVKAHAAPAAPPGEPADADAGDRSGTAYLRRRRADLSAREGARQAAASQAGRVHDDLCRLAVAGRRHPPQDARLSGNPRPMVLNAAYLVEGDRAAEFTGTVRALADRYPGVQVELTGPWPPYSFADVPELGR